MTKTEVITVLCSCPDEIKAGELATSVVESHLAACVSVIPEVRSIYRWKGRTEDQSEALLIIKTTQARLEALTEEIQTLHPYDEPEIIALPVVGGAENYLQWVRNTSFIS